MNELRQRSFQVRHSDSTIDTQALNLEEHRVVRWIGRIATEDTAGRDHAHGRAASLHRVDLDRRSLCSQGKAVSRIKGVLWVPRGMTLRNVKRVEVVKVCLDLAIIFDGVTERDKDVFDAFAHQSDRMQVPRPR